MVDAVTTQILNDGPVNTVIKLTNISDGSGETAVVKVDVSALKHAPEKVRIMGIRYTCFGMGVRLLWDADADVLAYALGADMSDQLDFRSFGGIQNNGGAGVTGDLLLTTVGHSSGDHYTIILELRKD